MHIETTTITGKLEKWYKEGYGMLLNDGKAALKLADKVLDNAIKFENEEYLVLGTALKAVCLVMLGKNDEALSTFNQAKRLHQQYTPNNKDYLAQILFNQAVLYGEQGNYQLSLDGYLRVLTLTHEAKKLRVYSNIGGIYHRMEEYPKAIEYYQKAKALALDGGMNIEFLPPKISLADCYLEINDIERAKKIAFEAFRFIEEHTDSEQIAATRRAQMLFVFGKIYIHEQKFEQALDMFQQALSIIRESAELSFSCSIHRYIAKIYFAKHEEKNALEHANKALQYANKAGLGDTKRHILESIVQFYKNTNQLSKASVYYEMLYKLSQEKLNISRNENLQKIIMKREYEIQLLEEKNKEIEEQNAILKQFAHIISHDLREPVRGITSFAGMLNRKYAKNLGKTGKEYLRFILSEAHSMNRNLARLLQYATIEKNKDNIKEVNLGKMIDEIQQQYQDDSFQLDINLERTSIKMQAQHTSILLTELIDNAVQFRKEDEDCRVEIKSELIEGHYHLSVKDYGIGIDAAYHDNIFKIFNKINKREETGAGVGLAICERIIQLYKGEISVESIPNQSTTFHITIPV